MKTITSFIIICVFLKFVAADPTDTNIAVYTSPLALHKSMVNEIDIIEDTWQITKNFPDLGVASASTTYAGFASSIQITNIKATAARLNPKKLNETEIINNANDFRIQVEGSSAFVLEFAFDYAYSYWTGGGSGKGDVTIMSFDTTVDIHYQLNSTETRKRGEIFSKVQTTFSDTTAIKLTGPYDGNAHVLSLAREAMFSKLTTDQIKKSVNGVFELEIDRYYLNNPPVLPLSVLKKELNLDYSMTNFPKILPDLKGTVFYHNGEVTFVSSNSTNLTHAHQIRESNIIWDDFKPEDGELQLFFGTYVLQDLFYEVTSHDYHFESSGIISVGALNAFYNCKYYYFKRR